MYNLFYNIYNILFGHIYIIYSIIIYIIEYILELYQKNIIGLKIKIIKKIKEKKVRRKGKWG